MTPEDRARFDKKLKKALAAAAKPRLSPGVRINLDAQLRSLANETGEFGVSAAVDEVSKFFLSRERLLFSSVFQPFMVSDGERRSPS